MLQFMNRNINCFKLRSIIFQNSFNFSLSNQDVRQHISKLIDFNETQISAKSQLEKETAELQIVQLEQELNQFLTQFHETQKQPYYLFRKNLVQLAYYSYYKSQAEQCQKYLKCAMLGDYLNIYEGNLLKAVFLAELHGILFLTNFNNRDEANIMETVKYWENAVQNLPNFKDLMENKLQSLNIFLQEIENVYVHQYIDNLIKAAKLCYRNGKLNLSNEFLLKASQVTDNLLNIISKQSDQPLEDEKYYKYYITEMKKFQYTSKIMLVKLYILTKQIQEAKNSLDLTLQSVDQSNSLYIILLIYKFDILYISEYNEESLEKIEQEIEDKMKRIEKNDDTSEILGEYCLFRIKYNLDYENEQKQIEQFNQLNQTQIIELQNHSIDTLMAGQQYEEALQLQQKQLNLIDNYHNSSHYLYEYTVTLGYFIMLKLEQYDMMSSQINNHKNQLYNVGNIDFCQIIEFYENMILFSQEAENQSNAEEILIKLEKNQFKNLHITFLKNKSLEICYQKLRLKDKLFCNLQCQLDYLTNIYSNNNSQIEEIQGKIKQVNC